MWSKWRPPCRWCGRKSCRSREAKLREQLGRLGGTPFMLGPLKNCLSGEVLLPVSELNRLRREAVAELEQRRAAPKRWHRVARSATHCSG